MNKGNNKSIRPYMYLEAINGDRFVSKAVFRDDMTQIMSLYSCPWHIQKSSVISGLVSITSPGGFPGFNVLFFYTSSFQFGM